MNVLLEKPPVKSPDDIYVWIAWVLKLWRLFDSQNHIYQKATDPTTTDIYVNTWAIYKNTGTGAVKLWANDAGTMKSVALV